jgi:hypothetical protein
MRRSLVLTDESARHPFRASLPPHVRMGKPILRSVRGLGLTRQDLRLFMTTYVSGSLAALAFIF